jgi:low affinity Fe/Cu permease
MLLAQLVQPAVASSDGGRNGSVKPRPRTKTMNEFFHRFAARTATLAGSPLAFIVAILVVLAWALTGPLFHYSDTWQLVINTGTTIITFLMVFLIQNSQNRDTLALHLKLDELLRAADHARTGLVDLEHASDRELKQLVEEFKRLRETENGSGQRAENENKR